jgi:hypothetical protein
MVYRCKAVYNRQRAEKIINDYYEGTGVMKPIAKKRVLLKKTFVKPKLK